MATVAQIDKKLRDQIGKVVKRLTAEVVAELVEDNPVLTGWSRSNWIPGTGAPTLVPVGSPDSTNTPGSRLDSAAVDAGLAVIVATYDIKQGVVTVRNNVPYITNINDFHPTKAGFVQTAIDRAVNTVIAQSSRLVRG